MFEAHVIIPDNVYVAVTFSFAAVVVVIRIVRWILDVIP